MADAPAYPIGAFEARATLTEHERAEVIDTIASVPAALRDAVDRLGQDRLDAVYRNWSARQIVLHVAESHMHSYIRFKWALAEDHPTIKAYDESAWAALAQHPSPDAAASLALVAALHAVWCALLSGMSDGDYQRAFHHPDTGEDVRLIEALQYYAWHGRHHTGQLRWLADQR